MKNLLRNWVAIDVWPRVPARWRKASMEVWRKLTYEWAFRYPAPYGVLMAGALAANQRRDARAPAVWRKLIQRFPDRSIGYAGLAGAFRFLGRTDEAVDAFRRALEIFPGDAVLLWEYGYLLVERGDNSAALEAFEQARAGAPNRPEAIVGVATALRNLLRLDEADEILVRARERFPRLCFVWCNYANVAEARGDREETARRWREILDKFPGEAISYAGLGSALSKLQRHDEAEAALEAGLERFPNDINLLNNAAWAAVGRADWPEASRRWADLVRRAPQDENIRLAASESAMHARLAEVDTGAPAQASPVPTDPSADSKSLRDLVGRFESIGENCELGFVQRYFGAEPLGVFRWAGIGYPALIDALGRRLEGIGDPEQTELLINPHNNEYYTQDRCYGMSMHTFILQGAASSDSIKTKMCRRLKYLREKLIEDFADSSKVFVFNSASPLTDEDLVTLRRALDPYGATPLLHTAPHPHIPPGAVAPAGERVWRASLSRTGYDGRVWDVDYENWETICQAAVKLWDAHPASRERATT